MYHSVTIGDYNLYDTWGLVPEEAPIIAPPEFDPETLDQPLGNGNINLYTIIPEASVFGNREGDITFLILWDWGLDSDCIFHALITDLLTAIHGKRKRLILEDDPDWYYEGRFEVTDIQNEEGHPKLTISYVLDSFKINVSDGVTKSL
jgi:hypothetical protein